MSGSPSAPDSKVIERIKKLLVKHDGCKKINSEAEAEVALNLAFQMMKKHHLSMSAVLTESAISDDEIFVIEKECEKYIANELPVWIQNLIQLINIVCNTECILRKYKTNRSAKQLYINFIGEQKDIDHCIEMYKFFKGVSMKLANAHRKKVKGTFTQWRSFSEGFTGRLLEKAVADQKDTDRKLKQFQHNSCQSIDDLDDISDEDDEEVSNEPSYGVILQTNELISINRYKCYVREKISEFLVRQQANRENLKESSKIDSSSFKQGQLAANQYDVTRRKSTLALTQTKQGN